MEERKMVRKKRKLNQSKMAQLIDLKEEKKIRID